MTALLRLCRPYYALPIALGFLLTVFYARGGNLNAHGPADLLAGAALALTVMSGHVLNDLFDLPVDRVNAPSRPLPAGRLRPRTAAIFGAAIAAAALAIAWISCPPFAAVLTAVTALLLLYNATSKRLGPVKPLLVAVLMTSIYPLALVQAGGARGPRAGSLAVFPAIVFLLTVSYELLKDIRDVAGDRLASCPGPLQRNPVLWRRLAHAVAFLALLLLPAPAFLGCHWVYLLGGGLTALLIATAPFLPLRLAIPSGYLQVALLAPAAYLDVVVLGF